MIQLKYIILLIVVICAMCSPLLLGDVWLFPAGGTGVILIGVMTFFAEQYQDESTVARFIAWNIEMRELGETGHCKKSAFFEVALGAGLIAVRYDAVLEIAQSLNVPWVLLPLFSIAIAGIFALVLSQ